MLLGLTILACSPIRSSTLVQQAASAVDAARSAQAAKHAPYEYTTARIYLGQALTEQSGAHYDLSLQYAERAQVCALAAQRVTAEKIDPKSVSLLSMATQVATCQRSGPKPQVPTKTAHREPSAQPSAKTQTSSQAAKLEPNQKAR